MRKDSIPRSKEERSPEENSKGKQKSRTGFCGLQGFLVTALGGKLKSLFNFLRKGSAYHWQFPEFVLTSFP
jgi:hypothetical protein